MNKFIIKEIEKASIFEELGVEAGDVLLTLNGKGVKDLLDYRFLSADERVLAEIEKPNGEIWELEIEKEPDEDLGVVSDENSDVIRTCKNKCIFCFIDQMPPGMRESLYVRDDDERLSFLMGNYVTLTNLTEYELQRIVNYKIMPINISVHTTEPELRKCMLNNQFAGDVLEKLAFFAKNKIVMNGQIVLCPDYNDGKHLEKTLEDLTQFYPYMQSVSVVPIGISKFREGLTEIKSVDQAAAKATIAIVEKMQKKMKKETGVNFAYASDEFYLLAGDEVPPEELYDGFPQIENGVGMITDFYNTTKTALEEVKDHKSIKKNIKILTGTLSEKYMNKISKLIQTYFPTIHLEVQAIRNEFFGEEITVSGLITAQDILKQVKSSEAIDCYMIPENMLKQDEAIFLDDVTLEELQEKFNVPIEVIPVNGKAFINAILKEI